MVQRPPRRVHARPCGRVRASRCSDENDIKIDLVVVIVIVTVRVSGTCFTENGLTSKKYSCDSTNITVATFSDLSCKTETSTTNYQINKCNSDGTEFLCSATSAYPVSGNYVLQTFYEENGGASGSCASSTIVHYAAEATGLCLPAASGPSGVPSTFLAFKFACSAGVPVLLAYSNSECSGTASGVFPSEKTCHKDIYNQFYSNSNVTTQCISNSTNPSPIVNVWLYSNKYTNSECTGTPYLSSGSITGHCMATSTGSAFYRCNSDGTASISTYTDSACKEGEESKIFAPSFTSSLGACSANGDGFSTKFQCSSSADYPLTGNYFLET